MKTSLKMVEVRVKLDDGRVAEAIFVREAKLQEIWDDRGGFGEFVRDLVRSMPPPKRGRVH